MWREYFANMANYHLKVTRAWGSSDIEDMYQAFKERLIDEMNETSSTITFSNSTYSHDD